MDRPVTTLFMLESLDGKISTGAGDNLDIDKDFPKIQGVKGSMLAPERFSSSHTVNQNFCHIHSFISSFNIPLARADIIQSMVTITGVLNKYNYNMVPSFKNFTVFLKDCLHSM